MFSFPLTLYQSLKVLMIYNQATSPSPTSSKYKTINLNMYRGLRFHLHLIKWLNKSPPFPNEYQTRLHWNGDNLKGPHLNNGKWDKSFSEGFALTLTYDQEILRLALNLKSSPLPLPTGFLGLSMSNIKQMGNNLWSKTEC